MLSLAGVVSLLFGVFLLIFLAVSVSYGDASSGSSAFTLFHVFALLLSGYFLVRGKPSGVVMSFATQLFFVSNELYHAATDPSAFEFYLALLGIAIAIALFVHLGWRSLPGLRPTTQSGAPPVLTR